MKKFFAIAFIAASFAACNNSGDKKPAEDTGTKAPIDTVTKAPDTATKAPIDTVAKGDTAK